VRLELLLTYPENSIINQAKDAQFLPGCKYKNQNLLDKRNCRVNADGFGVAWYSDDIKRKHACLFRSTKPSWGDCNLAEISSYVESPTIFAHVRAMTSPGIDPVVGAVSLQNCHPFKHKSFTFMHNGGIQHFSRIKRKMQSLFYDEFYNKIAGSTDSENIFMLFLSILKTDMMTMNTMPEEEESLNVPDSEMQTDLQLCQSPEKKAKCTDVDVTKASASQIASALSKTIQKIVDLMVEISQTSQCSLNLAVTNGTAIVATRFRRGHSAPPSLYFATVNGVEGVCGNVKIKACSEKIKRGTKRLKCQSVIISSEPLTTDKCWNVIGDNTMIVVHGDEKNRSIAGKIELQHLDIKQCKGLRRSIMYTHRASKPTAGAPSLLAPVFSTDTLLGALSDGSSEDEESKRLEAVRKVNSSPNMFARNMKKKKSEVKKVETKKEMCKMEMEVKKLKKCLKLYHSTILNLRASVAALTKEKESNHVTTQRAMSVPPKFKG